MARSASPAGSSSSDSSSSASSSSAASVASEAIARPAALESRPSHGEKRPFEPPPGYKPAKHSKDVLDAFKYDALSRSNQKQLWCIRVPDGISPQQLNGLVIPIPDHVKNDVLLQVKLEEPTQARSSSSASRAASASKLQKYSLRLKRGQADDMDAAHGVHGKNRRKEAHTGHESGMTQLIAMAGGNEILSHEAQGFGEQGNEEMESVQVMVPTGQDGRYMTAPMAISQYMQLTLDAPMKADITSKETAPDAAGVTAPHAAAGVTAPHAAAGKSKHQQPWTKLNGFFRPAGARDAADEGERPSRAQDLSSTKRKSSTADKSASPTKERKKDKKSIDKAEETEEERRARRQAKHDKKAAKARA